jgi:ATP-dependent Clp protease adaptor protein ClpS
MRKPLPEFAYYALFFLCAFAGALLVQAFDLPWWLLFLLVMILLTPRIIFTIVWFDHKQGIRLVKSKKYTAALTHSKRFLSRFRKYRWLRWLLMQFLNKRRRPEAMALHGVAMAERGLGQNEQARGHLEEAIALDPQWGLLYYSMGLVVLQTGTRAQARPWFDKASALGHSHEQIDKMMAAETRFEQPAQPATRFAAPSPADAQTEPADCLVLLLNDPATPMEFVIAILENVFEKTYRQSMDIMLDTHKKGAGVCGKYTRAVAAWKTAEVSRLAKEKNYPLQCVVVPNSPEQTAR